LALLTGNAYSGVFDNRYPTYRAGLQINLPLFGDKTAGAQYGRTLVEGERLELQRAQIEQLIQVDVRNALQAVRTAEARL
ncbi:TolC family protein, partial [Vibrio parahaemolyticus]|uniref:TolC family protein n=1 Tax=Vibrio parahaemolyticus TaxID=670 RepID=UPI001A8EB178